MKASAKMLYRDEATTSFNYITSNDACFTICISFFFALLPFDIKHIFNPGYISTTFSKNISQDIEGFHMDEGNEKIIYFQFWWNSQEPV